VRRLVPLALPLLLACESSAPPAASTATATASAAPAIDYLPIEATWKGKPLHIASAVAFSRGGDALHVSLSTHPLTCRDLRRGVQRVPGEVAVDLTFAPLLERNGDRRWTVTRARFGPVTRQGDLAPVEVSTFNPKEVIHTKLKATIPFPPDELTLSGSFEISGCGLRPWSKEARVIPQSELEVTLAGKPLSINGATIATESDGERSLRFSTEPHACKSKVGSDVAIIVTLPPDEDTGDDGKMAARSVRLEGYAFPRVLASTTPGSLSVAPAKPRADAPSANTGGSAATKKAAPDDVRLDLEGSLDLAGYALHVAGTVKAQRCP